MTIRAGGFELRFVRRGAALGLASVGVVVMEVPVDGLVEDGAADGTGLEAVPQGGCVTSKISAYAMGKQRSVIQRLGLMLAHT